MEFIEGFSEGAGTDEPCTAWAQAAKGLSINEQVLLEMGGYDEGYNQGSLWKEK